MKMFKVPVCVSQWHLAHVAAKDIETARGLAETAKVEQLEPIGGKSLKAADPETVTAYNPEHKDPK